MKPGACIQATIDLLTTINDAWEAGSRAPADALIAKYFRQRRYIGSKDRAAVAELIYYVLRNGGALEWWLEAKKYSSSPRAIVFLALVFHHKARLQEFHEWMNGDTYAPDDMTEAEIKLITHYVDSELIQGDMPEPARLNYPEWMADILHAHFPENLHTVLQALSQEAPVFLRANSLKTTREAVIEALTKEDIVAKAAALAPHAIQLTKRGPMFATKAFKNGWFEMQDEGSQLVAHLVDAKAGQKVIDFCAGAGGKTLAIAAAMKNKGRILAWDTNEARLSQITKRLARAGVNNVQTRTLTSEHDSFLKRHKDSADWVLLDVPCTGSGTWRRNPDLKWRTTPKDLEEVTDIQRRILKSAGRLVKPEGSLVYATCSFFKDENENQIAVFLSEHPDFEVVASGVDANGVTDGTPYLSLMPHTHNSDGFFAAVLRRKSSET